MSDDGDSPALEVRGATKGFGGVRALQGVDLTVTSPGIVHGLIGQNGCGKSTLLSILSGQLRPDSGELLLEGRAMQFANPQAAISAGITMVTQETALADRLTVTENILMGHRLRRRFGAIDWRGSDELAEQYLEQLQLDVSPRALVRELRADQRQLVEIARALSQRSRVIILDEPTSSLAEPEVDALFATIERLKRMRVSTILVTHRLPELMSMSDELTVMRDGRAVAAGPASEFDADRIVHSMVGESKELSRSDERRAILDGAGHRLAVEALTASGAFRDVNLTAAPGEIVGIAGLVGSGRSELLASLFGELPADGSIRLDGAVIDPRSPRRASAAGIAYVPPERKTQGVVLSMSISANLSMVSASGSPRLTMPSAKSEQAAFANAQQSLTLRAPVGAALVSSLSGGNQQKVAIGKWLGATPPRLLLLDEPTRGVDVSAKVEIHNLIKAMTGQGMTVLVSSSENQELLDLCDRIVVMRRGEVVAERAAEEATEEMLAHLSAGSYV